VGGDPPQVREADGDNSDDEGHSRQLLQNRLLTPDQQQWERSPCTITKGLKELREAYITNQRQAYILLRDGGLLPDDGEDSDRLDRDEQM
jgi:hypothetical protein